MGPGLVLVPELGQPPGAIAGWNRPKEEGVGTAETTPQGKHQLYLMSECIGGTPL